MNVLEYINFLVEVEGWDEEAAEEEASRAFEE